MDFTHYDLGNVKSGQVIELKLSGNAANIRLMDNSNYMGYKKKGSYRYIGGIANQSIIRIKIPKDGHWHVVIDMHGLKGTVKTSYKLVPRKGDSLIPETAEQNSGFITDDGAGKDIKIEVPEMREEQEEPAEEFMPEYDVFITYAKTEREKLVKPIVEALEAKGYKVWYEGFEISTGESLRRRIDKGLGNSRLGIVVMSKGLAKTKDEPGMNDEILIKSLTGEQLVLLVQHDVGINELAGYNKSLADKPAIMTAENSPADIADEAVRILKKNELFYPMKILK